ncbi:hypothetical protein JX265_011736 [Neoarthrinium moseri]|uniref:Uncharacterized protein n=1 Tax=Neoarthrinium moseri TaxID=1658444 RepID=A0A9P9WBQ4_9PEZI|nr:uncharacterized protein JN550_002038 [Neoarthrinium moseri]KAI1848218.1 hypothetical protein JX266_005931 [Neoarthrinium moseri]KAI1856224.1 hypothetical protein JX265_011736 [Neoarthrinium moseri]KAI1875752.1 hypothetical protein JN550_002038 [Neoarthrinium moseri]
MVTLTSAPETIRSGTSQWFLGSVEYHGTTRKSLGRDVRRMLGPKHINTGFMVLGLRHARRKIALVSGTMEGSPGYRESLNYHSTLLQIEQRLPSAEISGAGATRKANKYASSPAGLSIRAHEFTV